MSFRLVQKSVTLNGVMALILRYFTEFGSFRGEHWMLLIMLLLYVSNLWRVHFSDIPHFTPVLLKEADNADHADNADEGN